MAIKFKKWEPGSTVWVKGDHNTFTWWSVLKQSNNREYTDIFNMGVTRTVKTDRLYYNDYILHYVDFVYVDKNKTNEDKIQD